MYLESYHNSDVVPLGVVEGSAAAHQQVLGRLEGVVVFRVELHRLPHLFQRTVLAERIQPHL